jgi:hypothetical protein
MAFAVTDGDTNINGTSYSDDVKLEKLLFKNNGMSWKR